MCIHLVCLLLLFIYFYFQFGVLMWRNRCYLAIFMVFVEWYIYNIDLVKEWERRREKKKEMLKKNRLPIIQGFYFCRDIRRYTGFQLKWDVFELIDIFKWYTSTNMSNLNIYIIMWRERAKKKMCSNRSKILFIFNILSSSIYLNLCVWRRKEMFSSQLMYSTGGK